MQWTYNFTSSKQFKRWIKLSYLWGCKWQCRRMLQLIHLLGNMLLLGKSEDALHLQTLFFELFLFIYFSGRINATTVLVQSLLSNPVSSIFLHLEDILLHFWRMAMNTSRPGVQMVLKEWRKPQWEDLYVDEEVKVFFSAVPISLNGPDNVHLTHPDLLKTITQKPRSHLMPTAGIGLSLM